VGRDIENFTVFSNPVKRPSQSLRDGCKKTKRKYTLRGNREGYKVHTAQAFWKNLQNKSFVFSDELSKSKYDLVSVSSFNSFKENITQGDNKINNFSHKSWKRVMRHKCDGLRPVPSKAISGGWAGTSVK
jgi:hypothetical protein